MTTIRCNLVLGFILAASVTASPRVSAQEDLRFNAFGRPQNGEVSQAPLGSVGTDPVLPDFGNEADLVSAVDEQPQAIAFAKKNWNFSVHGFLRAPARVSFGPRNDATAGTEPHSPPRIVGANSDEWNTLNLAPRPAVSFYLQASNPIITGTVVVSAGALTDSGYRNLDQMGGISQAYVTLHLDELFGRRGGLFWRVGAFSDRYGMAGPGQQSSGYFGAAMFGRTHVVGETLTANINLAGNARLLLEDGLGEKAEVVPWIDPAHVPPPPQAPYLPDQGPVPKGSNFIHHAHAALLYSDWLTVAGHYMISWTPNDHAVGLAAGTATGSGKMTVLGGELHVDHSRAGNGYLGYSHVSAANILPLADGIQVLYGVDGVGFADNFFSPTLDGTPNPSVGGTVDTVAGQYILRLAPLLGRPNRAGADLAMVTYAMFNRAASDAPAGPTTEKLKLGGELQVAPLRRVSVGSRFDLVMPDVHDRSTSYSAITPRIVLRTNWFGREYAVLSYTLFLSRRNVVPSAPYADLVPDRHLLTLNVIVSF